MIVGCITVGVEKSLILRKFKEEIRIMQLMDRNSGWATSMGEMKLLGYPVSETLHSGAI